MIFTSYAHPCRCHMWLLIMAPANGSMDVHYLLWVINEHCLGHWSISNALGSEQGPPQAGHAGDVTGPLAILFWLAKIAIWPLRCLKMVPRSLSCQKTWNRHQKPVSTTCRTKVLNLAQIAEIWLVKMAIWPPGQIWGVWKWSQVIPHARKHGVWHQNQVSSLPRRKITNIPILRGMIFWTWSKKSTFESLNVGK